MQLKLTNQQILGLEQAINALDGKSETAIVDGKPITTVKPYKIAYNARWSLARNASQLATAVTAFQRARAALLTQHAGPDGALGPQSPVYNAFMADFNRLIQEPVEITLHPIAMTDLKLEDNERAGNELPIAVLTALMPLIETFPI